MKCAEIQLSHAWPCPALSHALTRVNYTQFKVELYSIQGNEGFQCGFQCIGVEFIPFQLSRCCYHPHPKDEGR